MRQKPRNPVKFIRRKHFYEMQRLRQRAFPSIDAALCMGIYEGIARFASPSARKPHLFASKAVAIKACGFVSHIT